MSEDSTEDKKYDPSERRLNELKKKGTILRAKDYGGGLMMLAGLGILILSSPMFLKTVEHIFRTAYTTFSVPMEENGQIGQVFQDLATNGLLLVLPLGIGLIAMAFLANFLLGGLHFSRDALKFKGERINLFKNLKKMFSLSKLFELIKSILKLLLFFGTFGFFIFYNEVEIISLSTAKDSHVLVHAFEMIRRFLFYMVPSIVVLALIDAVYNFFSFKKKTKMTLKEVKDERKDMDGSPELKQKIRSKQQNIARMNMQRDVPEATVVITNPTHYAVALKYNEDEDQAPKLVAKGSDELAHEIRMLAIKSGVPVYQAPPLARAIYFNGQVGSFIHEDLYRAVAMVLVYISQLKQYQHGLGAQPEYIQDLPLPQHLVDNTETG